MKSFINISQNDTVYVLDLNHGNITPFTVTKIDGGEGHLSIHLNNSDIFCFFCKETDTSATIHLSNLLVFTTLEECKEKIKDVIKQLLSVI